MTTMLIQFRGTDGERGVAALIDDAAPCRVPVRNPIEVDADTPVAVRAL